MMLVMKTAWTNYDSTNSPQSSQIAISWSWLFYHDQSMEKWRVKIPTSIVEHFSCTPKNGGSWDRIRNIFLLALSVNHLKTTSLNVSRALSIWWIFIRDLTANTFVPRIDSKSGWSWNWSSSEKDNVGQHRKWHGQRFQRYWILIASETNLTLSSMWGHFRKSTIHNYPITDALWSRFIAEYAFDS